MRPPNHYSEIRIVDCSSGIPLTPAAVALTGATRKHIGVSVTDFHVRNDVLANNRNRRKMNIMLLGYH